MCFNFNSGNEPTLTPDDARKWMIALFLICGETSNIFLTSSVDYAEEPERLTGAG